MATVKVFGYTQMEERLRVDNHTVFWKPLGATMDLTGCQLVVMPFAPLLGSTHSSTQQMAAEQVYRRARLCMQSGASVCLLCEHVDNIQGIGGVGVGLVVGGMFLHAERIGHNQTVRLTDLSGIDTLSPFLEEYASTNYHFSYYEAGKELEHKLCWPREDEQQTCGFVLHVGDGLLYVLPGTPVEGAEKDFITSLIRCLLADIRSRMYPETSPIVESFQFDREKQLRTSRQDLQNQLERIDDCIAGYNEMKDILFLRDTPLENRLPQWLVAYMGMKTRRHEEYNEDFWIVDETGTTDVAICEVKALSKNVKREHITALVQHREHRDLPDDFPSILFVNTFADVETLEEKGRQRITKTECQKAFRDNVLVVRTLDLVRLLDLVEQNKLETGRIEELFVTERGWLNVTDDGYEMITD